MRIRGNVAGKARAVRRQDNFQVDEASAVVEESRKSVEDIILQSAAMWTEDDTQVSTLFEARYTDGTPVLNEYDRDISLEVLQLIADNGFDATMTIITSAANYEDLIWNQPIMDLAKEKIQLETDMITYEPQGTVGLGTCRRCGGKELVSGTMQLRSGDEGMTEIYKCVKCNFEWKK